MISIFKRFKAWTAKRRIRHQERQRLDGFNWVMESYFQKKQSVQEIEAEAEVLGAYNYNYFDYGAHEAIRTLKVYEQLRRICPTAQQPQ